MVAAAGAAGCHLGQHRQPRGLCYGAAACILAHHPGEPQHQRRVPDERNVPPNGRGFGGPDLARVECAPRVSREVGEAAEGEAEAARVRREHDGAVQGGQEGGREAAAPRHRLRNRPHHAPREAADCGLPALREAPQERDSQEVGRRLALGALQKERLRRSMAGGRGHGAAARRRPACRRGDGRHPLHASALRHLDEPVQGRQEWVRGGDREVLQGARARPVRVGAAGLHRDHGGRALRQRAPPGDARHGRGARAL